VKKAQKKIKKQEIKSKRNMYNEDTGLSRINAKYRLRLLIFDRTAK
jgi:hypothetical protein